MTQKYKKLLEALLEARADKDRFRAWGGEELLQKFLTFKDRMSSPENDMTYWTSTKTPRQPEELNEIIKKLEKKAEKKKQVEDGAELIYEDDTWYVYKINTFPACQKYGARTKWCITSEDETAEDSDRNPVTRWVYYTEVQEGQFYFFINKKENKKYALLDNSNYSDDEYELYDEKDDLISYIEGAPTVEGLPNVSQPNPNGPRPPTPPPYTLEPVANPQTMEFTASSLEDALRQFNNATAVAQLRDDLHAIKFGDNKFTVFVFNGTAGGPLMTQQGPGQFSLVVFDNQETLVNWAQQNMPNIQVQNQAAANQPQQMEINYEEENVEEVEESIAKLDKETKKGDNIMEKEVKSMKEVKEAKPQQDRFIKVISLLYSILKEVDSDELGFNSKDTVDDIFHQHGLTKEEITYIKGENEEEKMGESKKPVTEKMGVEVYSYVGKDKLSTLDSVMVLKDLLDVMWNSVRLSGKGIKGTAILYADLDGGYELDLDKHSFGEKILKMKVKTDDSYDEDNDGYPIIYAELTDEPLKESKKPVTEKMDVEVYSYVDNQKLGTLDQVIVLRDLLDVMWNAVYLSGKGIDGRAVLFRDLDGEYELALHKHSFGEDILKMKVKTADSYDEDDDGYPIIYAKLTDEPLTEGKKPKITKKPLKEGIRLVYNPREKKTVKEEVKLSFDGEPLPVDIKESNTHTKLRLLKHK